MKKGLFFIVFFFLTCVNLHSQWYQQYSGISTNLYSIFSINGTTAWMTGANGVIIKTTNGGASWVQKPSGTSYSISFVHFFDQNEGIFAGSGGIVKKSSDGGETWHSVPSGTSYRLQEGFFVNDSVGYLIGDNGTLLKTTDRGNTWSYSSIAPENFSFIYFVNENTGFVTTEWTGQIWKTTDAGNTWALKQIIGNYSVWQIHFVDENNGWVVGEFGTIAKTSDGGESWSLQYSGTNVNLRSVYFHTPEIGWVVGKDEKRLRTTNGGNNWIHDYTGFNYEYLYIYFYDNNIGWICGTGGSILYTDNGGIGSAPFTFEKTFGGVSSEMGVDMEVTDDNGLIIAGSTSSFSNQDMYLIKLDSTSTLEWSKIYHSNGDIDRIHDVKQTSDGGYYLVGYIEGGFGFLDHSILRVDPLGNLIWAKNFGGIEADELRGISITTDGGALVSGYNASFGAGLKDVQIIKFFSDGSVDWAKNFGTVWEDHNSANIIATDGNFIFSGETDISGNLDWKPTLIKADTLGNILWAKYYPGFNDDWTRDLIEAPDGGYFIVGETRSYGLGGSEDIYLIKTTINGDVEWAKAYGGISNERGWSIDLTSNNKIIIAGFTSSFGFGGYDAFLMKLNLDGTLVWFHTYGGYTDDYAYNVEETPDLGYALTGRRSTNTIGSDDVYLIKTDHDGNSSCDFGIFSPNVFAISNLQAIILNMSTSNVVSVSDLPLTVFTPNTAENISCSIIPVELKSFNYKLEKNDVILNWTTATETNNMGFKIFRNKIEIGFVPGAGTSTELRTYLFRDENIENGNYLYSLVQIDYDGTTEKVGEIEVVVENIPTEYSLQQNYPNPFNPSTTIMFSIPEVGKIVLEVFDVLGRKITELINREMSVGNYDVQFDASDLPSGIYFYTLKAGKFIAIKKMILLK